VDLGLQGKNAVVTGGSHGIGLATAKMLASEGCNIAIISRDSTKLKKAKKEIASFGVECHTIQADVLKQEQVQESILLISKLWDKIHILINNVGGGGRWGTDNFIANPTSVWTDVYNKNVTCAIAYTRFSLPYMIKQEWGRVITVTSTLGRQAGGRPWFNIAKTAQTCLMKNLSLDKELVRKNITFNSVAPGCIMIPNTGWEEEAQKDPNKFSKMLEDKFPLGRMGTPEEVAYSIAMLCSTSASLINGAALAADGGESYAF
tara:strand:- start:4370 stop:5152 length:783 start_codon:yes stop_codon:yes gene_type:complete